MAQCALLYFLFLFVFVLMPAYVVCCSRRHCRILSRSNRQLTQAQASFRAVSECNQVQHSIGHAILSAVTSSSFIFVDFLFLCLRAASHQQLNYFNATHLSIVCYRNRRKFAAQPIYNLLTVTLFRRLTFYAEVRFPSFPFL